MEWAWKDARKRLIPLLVGDAKPPVFLRGRVAIRMEKEPGDWDRFVRRKLADVLRGAKVPRIRKRNVYALERQRRKRFGELKSALMKL